MASYSLPKEQMISVKGLTVGQLLKATEGVRKTGSSKSVIKDLRFTKTGNGLIVAKAMMSSTSRRGMLHNTWVTFMDITNRSQMKPSSKVMIQCSCEDYCFVWEYANTAHNAARIFYCNGEPPDERNPAQRPGLCKHAYRLAFELITRF